MKRILLPLTLISFSTFIFGQSGQKWATGGNSSSTGDFLGTTNNFPLDFKTNNVLRMSLGTNGVLKLSALSGSNTRLLQVDVNGNIISLPQGSANQYLSGTGAWVNVPNVNNLWSANGSSMYYNNGYVGIGTSTPLFPLDVIGDARISNNLYVGGGVIITDKVRATGDVKTGRLEADTIKLDASRIITGETNVFGDTKLKFKLDVSGPSTFNDFTQFNQQVNLQSSLNAFGSANFVNNVQLNKGFTFDGNSGIRLLPASGNRPQTFLYGGVLQPLATYCAAGPQAWANHQFGGMVQIYDYNNPTTSGLLNLQTWTNGSSIDASTGGQSTGGLLLNYFCHSPTFINTGWDIPNGVDGGRVYMGAEVDMQKSLKIGWTQSGTIDQNTSIEINQNDNNGYGTKVQTWNSSVKAFAVTNSSSNVNNFEVYGDGRTVIGSFRPAVGYMLSVSGKIMAEEVVVQLKSSWPDYVFQKDYKLKPLSEVEQYISKHKHLQNIPSAKEIETNGVTLGNVVSKQMEKIEELTLYLIEQQKQIEELKKQIESLKK